MSGHSHWATIKRSKAANDAKRGKVWSKVAKRIIVAAKAGGGNPEENLQLRYAIDDPKAANVPKDTIANAIKKVGTDPEKLREELERTDYIGTGGHFKITKEDHTGLDKYAFEMLMVKDGKCAPAYPERLKAKKEKEPAAK